MVEVTEGLESKNWILGYQIDDSLEVSLNDTYFLHPLDSYTGSEAVLSENIGSENEGWIKVSSIKGRYAGGRPKVLKVQLDSSYLSHENHDRGIIVIPFSKIEKITKFN